MRDGVGSMEWGEECSDIQQGRHNVPQYPFPGGCRSVDASLSRWSAPLHMVCSH